MVKEFYGYLKKYIKLAKKKNIYGISIISVLTIIISIFTPALIAQIITCMLKEKYDRVIISLVLLAVLQIVKLSITILSTKLFYDLRKDFIVNLKNSLARSILHIDMKSFNKTQKGKFIQRINKDPDIIADLFNGIKQNVLLLCTNIGIIIYIVYLNPILGGIYLLSFILSLYIRKKGIDKKRLYRKEYLKEEEKGTGLWSEILNGIKEIKLLNVKKQFTEKTKEAFRNTEDYQYKADFTFNMYVKLTVIIEWVANALVVITSIFLIQKGFMSVDTFITVFMYRVNIFSFADNFTDLLDMVANFNLSSNRIFEIMDLYEDREEQITENNQCLGNIKFDNVKFKYEDKYILYNCNFKVNANEKIAIIGENGSGKTTILNLIARTYMANEGNIYIDNVNINELSENYIRKNISIISQDFYIFNMSIKDNLRLANPKASDEEIYEACRKVNLEKYILSLPDKYETLIGENGVNLSGGQRQRLAIARALLKKSKILLLDEATSSLDKDIEYSIFELLDELKEKHTIIVVTHNLNYIKNFEKKYILKNGEIANYE